jgi:PhzF family phenazine biosynthesis protein
MQAIAVENNLSETAFIIEENDRFDSRWFTPKGEINLCGHATLAAGFVLFELGKSQNNTVAFTSLSGLLTVTKKDNRYILDFPRLKFLPSKSPELITAIINQAVIDVFDSDLDYLVLMADEATVLKTLVNLARLSKLPKRGLILTAASSEVDFYSRCFYPKHNIPEDPVTGSAHCVLAPFWSERLNKNRLKAIQGSSKKGEIYCDVLEHRVLISGHCKWFLKGRLVI